MGYTMIDLFAGIGGFRLGFEAAGAECIGFCEIDKFAQKTYRAIHGEKGEWFAVDITELRPEDVPKCDIITAGFPCQDISVSNNRGAGLDGNRSSLFFEIIRILKGKKSEDRPTWVILENVKNLLHIAGGRDLALVLCALAEVGYDVEYQVLNSKNYYVPQNRERCYFIGHHRGRCTRKIFPISGADGADIIQIIGGNQGNRVYSPEGIAVTQTSNTGGLGGKTGLYTMFVDLTVGKGITATENARCIKAKYTSGVTNRQGEKSGVLCSPCAIVTPNRVYKRQNGRRIKEPEEPMFCLTIQDRHGVVLIKEATLKGYAEAMPGDSIDLSLPNSKTRRGRVGKLISNTLETSCNKGVLTDAFRIRRLTPRECWRLQAVDDDLFDRAREVCSDSQLYKQAGNGVTVSVVYAIAKELLNKNPHIEENLNRQEATL